MATEKVLGIRCCDLASRDALLALLHIPLNRPTCSDEFLPREPVNRLLSELCVLKCLRPDRMVDTLNRFLLQHLDKRFVEPANMRLLDVYQVR